MSYPFIPIALDQFPIGQPDTSHALHCGVLQELWTNNHRVVRVRNHLVQECQAGAEELSYLPVYTQSLADLTDLIVGRTVEANGDSQQPLGELTVRALELIAFNEQAQRLQQLSIEHAERLTTKERLKRYITDPYLAAVVEQLELQGVRRPRDPQRVALATLAGYQHSVVNIVEQTDVLDQAFDTGHVAYSALTAILPSQIRAEQNAWQKLS